jgi:hypothetical protein
MIKYSVCIVVGLVCSSVSAAPSSPTREDIRKMCDSFVEPIVRPAGKSGIRVQTVPSAPLCVKAGEEALAVGAIPYVVVFNACAAPVNADGVDYGEATAFWGGPYMAQGAVHCFRKAEAILEDRGASALTRVCKTAGSQSYSPNLRALATYAEQGCFRAGYLELIKGDL